MSQTAATWCQQSDCTAVALDQDGLPQAHGVQINASSPTTGGSLVGSLLLGFGPTLLFIGLFVVFAPWAARGGAAGALGDFGRSQARHDVMLRWSGEYSAPRRDAGAWASGFAARRLRR